MPRWSKNRRGAFTCGLLSGNKKNFLYRFGELRMTERARQLVMDFMLLLVTFFWGSTFFLVKNAVAVVDVYSFLTTRFGLAFLVMIILFPRRLRRLDWSTLKAGAMLGILLFASFAFQTWGLTLTSATNGAFITGLNVVLVPIFSVVFFRRFPAPSV